MGSGGVKGQLGRGWTTCGVRGNVPFECTAGAQPHVPALPHVPIHLHAPVAVRPFSVACPTPLAWRRQCAFGTCCRSFHVLCGRAAGQQLTFRATDGEPLAFCELHSRPAFEKMVRGGCKEPGLHVKQRVKRLPHADALVGPGRAGLRSPDVRTAGPPGCPACRRTYCTSPTRAALPLLCKT